MKITQIKLQHVIAISLLFISSQLHSKSIDAKLTKAPKLDGALNDQCWQQSKWHTGFSILNKPQSSPDAQTKFKVCHDNQNLYFAILADEPFIDKLKTENNKRDGHLWHDDCVELFLDSNDDQATYYHFAINSKGFLYDSERRQGGTVGEKSWNCKSTKIATKINRDNWTVELAIPFVELGIETPTNQWGFNIARERKTIKEYSTFSPLNGGFHQAAKFAKLNLKNATLAKYCWTIKSPYDMKCLMLNGHLNYRFKTYIHNSSSKFKFIKVSAFINNQDKQAIKTGLDHDTGDEMLFTLPTTTGKHKLYINIRDRLTGELLASKQSSISVTYTPLSISLTEPCYRNNIYATQNISALKGTIIIGIENYSNTQISIKLESKAGQTITSSLLKNAKEKNSFSLAIPKLSAGTYTLIASLIKGEKINITNKLQLRKLAPQKEEVRIDKNLVTRVNGKPFLPYGWYSISPETAAVKGYNTIVDYCAYYKSDAQLKKWLDKHHELGLKVVIYPYPKRSYNNADTTLKPLSPEEAKEIRTFIKKWKNHPALLAWYIADEPEVRDALSSRFEAIYELCKEEDPYHPCIMLNDTIRGIFHYANGGDICDPDPYPLFLQGGKAAKPIEKVGKFIHAISETGQGRKAAWATLQGFNYGDFGRVNNRTPNFIELRNMQWQAVINGCTGFTWWAYAYIDCYPEIIEGVNYLRKEANFLKNLILSPQKRKKLKTDKKLVQATFSPNIDNTDWLIIVNTNPENTSITIQLPAKCPSSWYALAVEKSFKSQNGQLHLNMKGYETFILSSQPPHNSSLSLAAVQSKIAKRKQAMIHPGNLVQKPCKITFSSVGAKYKLNAPYHVKDGCRTCLGWTPDKKSKLKEEWLKVTFPRENRISKIDIYTKNSFPKNLDATIQIKQGKAWQTIGKFEKVTRIKMSSHLNNSNIQELRLRFLNSKPLISNLEIY